MAAGMKRMALAKTDNRHGTALDDAMFPDGLLGIAGTGRVEPATRADKRADQVCIQTYQSDDEFLHLLTRCQCFSSER